jgi:hypothetical protein
MNADITMLCTECSNDMFYHHEQGYDLYTCSHCHKTVAITINIRVYPKQTP